MTWGAQGPWTLTGKDWPILTVVFAFQINITAHGGEEGDCTIRLEGGFELHDPNGTTVELDAAQQSWEELAPVLSLRHDTLTSLVATHDASLLVRFGSGRTLTAEADDRPYEHWAVTAPEGELIALPGRSDDGVAVFSEP